MASQMVIQPSKDTLFMRGFSSKLRIEEIRDFFNDEGGKNSVEFFKETDDKTRLYVALKFDNKDAARDMISRFDNTDVLGDRISISWFKDLRRARQRAQEMGYQPRYNPRFDRNNYHHDNNNYRGGYNNNRFAGRWRSPTRRGRMYNDRYDHHHHHHNPRSRSRSESYDNHSRSRSRSRSRSTSDQSRSSVEETRAHKRRRSRTDRERERDRDSSPQDSDEGRASSPDTPPRTKRRSSKTTKESAVEKERARSQSADRYSKASSAAGQEEEAGSLDRSSSTNRSITDRASTPPKRTIRSTVSTVERTEPAETTPKTPTLPEPPRRVKVREEEEQAAEEKGSPHEGKRGEGETEGNQFFREGERRYEPHSAASPPAAAPRTRPVKEGRFQDTFEQQEGFHARTKIPLLPRPHGRSPSPEPRAVHPKERDVPRAVPDYPESPTNTRDNLPYGFRDERDRGFARNVSRYAGRMDTSEPRSDTLSYPPPHSRPPLLGREPRDFRNPMSPPREYPREPSPDPLEPRYPKRQVNYDDMPAYDSRRPLRDDRGGPDRIGSYDDPRGPPMRGDEDMVTKRRRYDDDLPPIRDRDPYFDDHIGGAPRRETGPTFPSYRDSRDSLREPLREPVREWRERSPAAEDRTSSRGSATVPPLNGGIAKEMERGAIGLPSDKMVQVREKKEEIEQAYRLDCETFAAVTKMLISKDATLEEKLQQSLRENLKDIGQRCITELRDFIQKARAEPESR